MTTGVDLDGVGVGVDLVSGGHTAFIVGNGVEWLGMDGAVRDEGIAECLPPMSRGAQVAVDVIDVGGRERVIRVECQTLPTELYWDGERGLPFHAFCEALPASPEPPPAMSSSPC